MKSQWRSVDSVHRMQAVVVENQVLNMLGVYGVIPQTFSTETVGESPSLVQGALLCKQYENVFESLHPFQVKGASLYQTIYDDVINKGNWPAGAKTNPVFQPLIQYQQNRAARKTQPIYEYLMAVKPHWPAAAMNVPLDDATQRTLLGAAGLVLGHHLSLRALAATPSAKAKAKSVIQIWMWGGPSHLDTWDPKPEAGNDYCGPLNKPIATNVDGIRICELMPQLAKQADKYAIIRGMTHGNNGHETAAYLMQTGHLPGGRLAYPSVGAIFTFFKKDQYKGLIPPYVVMLEAAGRFSEEGFLGPAYKPFATGGDPNAGRFEVQGIVNRGIDDGRQKARRELVDKINLMGYGLADVKRRTPVSDQTLFRPGSISKLFTWTSRTIRLDLFGIVQVKKVGFGMTIRAGLPLAQNSFHMGSSSSGGTTFETSRPASASCAGNTRPV